VSIESHEDTNLFNDNVDYTCVSFADTKRLNESLQKVALKFRLLDPLQSPPILRTFLSNIEIIQTFLGDLEGLLIDPDRPKKDLVQVVQELNDTQARALKKIEEANKEEAKRIGKIFILSESGLDHAWDPKFCHKSVQIDGKKVSSTGSCQGVLGNIPNAVSFKVKLLTGAKSNTMVGMALQSKFLPTSGNHSASGWFLYLGCTSLYSMTGQSNTPYADHKPEKIPLNSTIEVLFDKSSQQISFVVNGTNLGVAFSNIPTEENLFPCVEFYEKGSLKFVALYLLENLP